MTDEEQQDVMALIALNSSKLQHLQKADEIEVLEEERQKRDEEKRISALNKKKAVNTDETLKAANEAEYRRDESRRKELFQKMADDSSFNGPSLFKPITDVLKNSKGIFF